ncbi:MAG: hypothetical protein HQ530_01605 [Parcubacteria group bacterium]|nr:hypothetical protein [Parcubacteria group bacterium]
MHKVKTAGVVLAIISAAALLTFLAIMFYLAFVVNFSPDSRLLGQVACCLGVFGFGGLIVGLFFVCIKESTLARIKRRHIRWTLMVISVVATIIGCALMLLGAREVGDSMTLSLRIGLPLFFTGGLAILGSMCLASYVPGEKVKVYDSGAQTEERCEGIVDQATYHYIWVKLDNDEIIKVPSCLIAPA